MASTPVKDDVVAPPRTPATRAPGAAPARVLRGSARFWIALFVLVVSAVGLNAAANWLNLSFRKIALPLKAPLAAFNYFKLGPRYEVNAFLTDRLMPLSEDTVESIGTKDYVQFYVRDNQAAPLSPVRNALVFITYYTGKPDLVPHVPDECFQAAGYALIEEGVERLPLVGPQGGEFVARVMEFEGRRKGLSGLERKTVSYFFHANGLFATTRNDVRKTMLLNLTQRYAYYAKVEVTFMSDNYTQASRAETLSALPPLVNALLGVLLTDHIDLETFRAAAGGAAH